jgi:hypothetical protein
LPRITVLGSFVADLTFRAGRLPAWGETVLGDSFAIARGERDRTRPSLPRDLARTSRSSQNSAAIRSAIWRDASMLMRASTRVLRSRPPSCRRVRPGQPQENGAHERMHRTMKRRALKPVQRTCVSQRKQFDAFRTEHNTERPHEALHQDTPATHYTTSPRPYPSTLPTIEYPLHFLVKKVTDAGTFRFQKRLLYVANSLVDQHVGLEETDDGIWSIYFSTVLIATVDERDYIIRG